MRNILAPIHLSHSSASRDGGIAIAVSQLLEKQQEIGMFSRWLTADQFQPWSRDRSISQVLSGLDANVLHCHGLWRSPTRMIAHSSNHKQPLIISPHGMLDPWAMAYSPWKKWIVWQLWEAKATKAAKCLHALCESEAQSIRSFVGHMPIATIPNGVKIPLKDKSNLESPVWSNLIPEGEKVLLFLGRYHQKKGIEPLISAWQSVAGMAKKTGWWLIFIGFGDDGRLESQLRNFPVERCFAFGPLFGEEKASALAHSSAFILPSYSEGLPMAALEAMSYGLPCLLSQACNLSEAYEINAAIKSEPESAGLIYSLESLFALNEEECAQMGRAGKFLVSSKYNWNVVAGQFAQLYEWVLGLRGQPDFVQ